MKTADYLRLVLLAAIWGASFIFMRVAAPVLGPAWTSECRVLIGGLALLAWARATGADPGLLRHARFYFLLGTAGIALPFLLYSFAAMHAPASLLAIANASAPIFGLAWSALFRDERITARKALGLALGLAGVALLARPGQAADSPLFGWSIAAALGACCLYGLVGVLVRRFAGGATPGGMAVGNQLAAALVILPVLPFAPPLAAPTALVVACVLGLALLSSGLAFVLYFRLIADVGATRALTVTYLIPLFGLLFAALFLGESPPASALAGGALILAGTVLVTRG